MIRTADDDLTTSDSRRASGKQTASADRNAPGYVTIHDGTEMVIGFWSWNPKAVYKSSKTGATHISFRTDMWLDTTAPVSEVMSAMGAAQLLWTASQVDDKRTRAA